MHRQRAVRTGARAPAANNNKPRAPPPQQQRSGRSVRPGQPGGGAALLGLPGGTAGLLSRLRPPRQALQRLPVRRPQLEERLSGVSSRTRRLRRSGTSGSSASSSRRSSWPLRRVAAAAERARARNRLTRALSGVRGLCCRARRCHCSLIGVGLLLWVLAVVGCAVAPNYGLFLAARMLVRCARRPAAGRLTSACVRSQRADAGAVALQLGAGEASFVSLAAPFIDDAAPATQRAKWLALFYVFLPTGAPVSRRASNGGRNLIVAAAPLAWRQRPSAGCVAWLPTLLTLRPSHACGMAARARRRLRAGVCVRRARRGRLRAALALGLWPGGGAHGALRGAWLHVQATAAAWQQEPPRRRQH
eukprot:scaffold3297_cov327-Prasinococcus_capsulatus_cf.AAC.3